MSEPVLTPNDTLTGVESTRSSSPTQAGGLHHDQRSPSYENLFPGRVEDSYPSAAGYLVAIYNYKRNLPCFALQGSLGRFFGAKDHGPISVGTEVLVYCPRDGKFGIILGTIPTIQDPPHARPAGQLVPEGGVNAFSDKECFNVPDWGVLGLIPQASSAQPVDALPGDDGVTNENGVSLGIGRLFAYLKGSDLAGIEAYTLDDFLRIVGHRLEILTAAGEEKINNDYGRITHERLVALTESESLGTKSDNSDTSTNNDNVTLKKNPDESSLSPVTDGAVGRWRYREEEGYLSDFIQKFLTRPSQTPRALDGKNYPPDLALFQEYLSTAGQHYTRSLAGSGSIKPLGIAAPQRIRADEDEEGDREITDQGEKTPFNITPSGPGPAAFSAMVRDFIAWTFDHQAKQSRSKLKKDWKTLDDRDALTPAPGFAIPGVGSYFREFPPIANTSTAQGDVPDDSKNSSVQFRPGEAFSLLLPDGSVHSRDAWGTEVFTRGGHANVTASHDINLNAGGSIILQAGDDIVLRAQQAVDLSSTKNQIRVKADKDILVHSDKGGMMFTAPTRGGKLDDYSSNDSKGEKISLTGITFKTEGTVTTIADTSDFALNSYLFVSGQTAGAHPGIYLRSSAELHWCDGAVSIATGGGSSGMLISSGNVYATGNFQNDGSVYTRGNLDAGGGVTPGSDFSKVDKISDSLKEEFDPTLWEKFQQPYNYKDLGALKFSFRSTVECATTNLESIESAWQRELSDLSSWQEKPVNDTYPWPGKDHYSGSSKKYFTYNESNVEKSGLPKAREDQTADGGDFSPNDFNSIKVLNR